MKRAFFALLVISSCSIPSLAKYSGGTGEPNTPYRIVTAADMNEIGANPADWSSHFLLVNDVNLAGYTGSQFKIIGNTSISFTGVFDGNEHTIANFTYSSTGANNVGLFGRVNGADAVIKNLTLIDANVVSAGNAGILAGYTIADISNCRVVNGQVSSTGNSVGGLIGYCDMSNKGSVSNCYAEAIVSGVTSVGGLIGLNLANVSRCWSIGTVRGADEVGGLIGENFDCHGGANISYCYSLCDVSGNLMVGGLIGRNWSFPDITNCYAAGRVTGNTWTGGLAGSATNPADVIGCFWDINTSGQNTSAGGTGLNTSEMKQQSSFVSWDFNDVWSICEGTNYPRLIWQIPAADFVCPDGVSFHDYSFFAERWLNTDCAANNDCDGTDFDSSGAVDIADLKVFCGYWLQEL